MKNKVSNIKDREYYEASSSCLCFDCIEYYYEDCFKMNHGNKKNQGIKKKK